MDAQNKITQNRMILEHLESGKAIDPLTALEKFGCFRLSGRIFDLRAQGYNIITERTTQNGKTFATYKMLVNH